MPEGFCPSVTSTIRSSTFVLSGRSADNMLVYFFKRSGDEDKWETSEDSRQIMLESESLGKTSGRQVLKLTEGRIPRHRIAKLSATSVYRLKP